MGWQSLVVGTILTGVPSLAQANSHLLWHHQDSGEQFQHPLSQNQLQPGGYLPPVQQPWQMVGTGDFNGDGHPDLFWRQPNTGSNAIQWLMDGQHQRFSDFAPVNPGWQVAAVGDLDGDRLDDLIWYHSGSGQYYLWLLQASGLKTEAPLFSVTDSG